MARLCRKLRVRALVSEYLLFVDCRVHGSLVGGRFATLNAQAGCFSVLKVFVRNDTSSKGARAVHLLSLALGTV